MSQTNEASKKESQAEPARPHRTSMEGMIWNANHVLETAMKPGIQGIPKWMFEGAAGVVIVSIVDVGFILSGAVGSGIMMARYSDGSWSNPVACGLTGIGFGLVVGGEAKDVIVFLPDKYAVQTFFSTGAKIQGNLDLTVGIGRNTEGAFQASKSGYSDILSVGFSKGLMVAVALEGAVVGPRNKVNEMFYGKEVDPKDIIESGKVSFPEGKTTLFPEVLEKLGKLAQGVAEEPKSEEASKKEEAKAAADAAAEEIHEKHASEVAEVDAAAEAAKEAEGGDAAASAAAPAGEEEAK